MPKILKYKLAIGTSTIELPKFAKILHVHSQGAGIYLWASVDTNQPVQKHKFGVFATGEELPVNDSNKYDNYKPEVDEYIGTVHLCDGGFVFHIFSMSF
jgi:hypothetical protein